MLHARIARFDVIATVALFGKSFRELNKCLYKQVWPPKFQKRDNYPMLKQLYITRPGLKQIRTGDMHVRVTLQEA